MYVFAKSNMRVFLLSVNWDESFLLCSFVLHTWFVCHLAVSVHFYTVRFHISCSFSSLSLFLFHSLTQLRSLLSEKFTIMDTYAQKHDLLRSAMVRIIISQTSTSEANRSIQVTIVVVLRFFT